MSKPLAYSIIGALLVLLSACVKPRQVTPYEIVVPPLFPSSLNIPADNPMTLEGVELGRRLFYDGRLSGRLEPDSLMSCGTCHRQEHAFEAGLDHPLREGGRMRGLTGKVTPHAMLPIFNLVFRESGYLWSGKVHASQTTLGSANYGVPAQEPFHLRNIESLVWMMIAAPHEADGQINQAVERIAAAPEYPALFEQAFGSPEINIDRISKAIAQFIRTLISGNAKFDQYLRGEYSMSDDELAGYVLFTTERADCFHCHGGDGNMLMSNYGFSNNGLDAEHHDSGDRSSVTKKDSDRGKYLIPTLRNIEFTAPYMHDGRFETLDEVIDFYSEGLMWSPTIDPLMKQIRQGGVQLTPREKYQLKQFLYTLSDHEFIQNPNFKKP